MSSLLEIRDLKVNYGGIEALKGVSFDVKEGEIVTLIGANGAGKSTTLRAIMSVVNPASRNHQLRGQGHHPRRYPRYSSARHSAGA